MSWGMGIGYCSSCWVAELQKFLWAEGERGQEMASFRGLEGPLASDK